MGKWKEQKDAMIRIYWQVTHQNYNYFSGDGCSTTCAIEQYFSCSGNPSLCHSNNLITFI